MGDYGIKVSQEGYDVRTCADKDLLFSSSWPTLEILYEGETTVPSMGTLIFNHGLGYPPAFLCYLVASNNATMASSPQFIGAPYIDNDNLSILSGAFGDRLLHYIIFNWNLLTNYTSPVSGRSSSLGDINKDYGVKISKEGYDVGNCDIKDQVLNSGGRTPMIHMAGYGTMASFVNAEITHNLGYIPFFLDYVDEGTGGYFPRRSYDISATDSGISIFDHITTTKLTIPSYLPGGDYAYIIFKDPVE
jgi:hypothetical protein